MKGSGPRGGLMGIPGKHLIEITSTALLLSACPAFTCNTLPRTGICRAPHTTQPYPGQLRGTSKARTKQPSAPKGKLGEEEFARATLCLIGALLGDERTSPLRATHKSSLAPQAICRQVLVLFLGAAAILKARYASKQAR